MNTAHADMDDCSDWANGPMQQMLAEEHAALEAARLRDLEADYTAADRAEGVYTAPQGRAEQGWRIRPGNVAEMACYAPDDEPPREDMSPAAALLLMAIYCVSCVLVVSVVLTAVKHWS